MFSKDEVIDLIKAHKSGEEELFDNAIQKLVMNSERKGKKGVAKALRDIYVKPNDMFKPMRSSSLRKLARSEEYVVEDIPTALLDDVVLSKRNTAVVDEIILTWKNRRKLKEAGVSHATRVLLYGQPGTGKTLLANALAGSMGLPITYVDVSKLISSYLGETGKNINDLFSGNEERIIFLDEFESLAKKRADEMDIGEAKRIVTSVLQNLDALGEDVLLVAATNHVELIDSAIRRRFNYELSMDSIDQDARKRLIEIYLSSHKLKKDLSETLSGITDDFTGHDIQRAYNSAIRRSVLGLDKLTFEEQISKQVVEAKYRKKTFNSKSERDVKELRQVVKWLWSVNKRHFTYDTLENMTGIPHATIHYILNKENA